MKDKDLGKTQVSNPSTEDLIHFKPTYEITTESTLLVLEPED